MLPNALLLHYDVTEYPFQAVLSKTIFGGLPLCDLHQYWKQQTGKQALNYQDNLVLRKRMQLLPEDALFYKLYHKWIAHVLAVHYGKQLRYTAHPKMRVHLAGTGSVSDFHRDVDVTGRVEQINCFLPFTPVSGGATIWCQATYDSETYIPLNLEYGQALLWDGGYLRHGTYINDTDVTRVSCDFRFHAKYPELVQQPWNQILSGRTGQDAMNRRC